MTSDVVPALEVKPTPIPGLLVVTMPVHGDNRGWFKENWQREKFTALGFPDFGPVQNNVSYNASAGTTRGIHAEPWDKFVSVVHGRAFGAWVDLREGATYGTVYCHELDASTAIFVPRGVGNSFQTLEDHTVYSYLVNDHWSPNAAYANLNLADPTVAIAWPYALQGVEVSAKDREHPRLDAVTPIRPRKTLVLGADGQLGRALRDVLPDSHTEFCNSREFDLTARGIMSARNWRDYSTIINAAAFTAVDAAETSEGRGAAWEVNAAGPARLAHVAAEFGITLVHISSDYVFDGTDSGAIDELAPLSPLGVYGQTKAAGDVAVATAPRHYILRTSWVVGDGANFVRTMHSLALRGISPRVVGDQFGRLSFTHEIARAIVFLLQNEADYGTYNVTGAGEPMSWADIARAVFTACGRDAADVSECSTEEYFADAPNVIAPRPRNSTLSMQKIERLGFRATDATNSLQEYVAALN